MLHEVSESKLQEVSEVGQLSDKLGQQNEIKGLPDKITPESCDGEKKYSHCPIEGHNGSWEGEPGDSKWKPEQTYIPGKANTNDLAMGELMDKCGIDGINFKDGEPDFSTISRGEAKIENFSENRSDNFDQADMKMAEQHGCTPQEVAAWRKANGYTWHECKDMQTMQKVPSAVHNNVPHSGGISAKKAMNAEV